jgi:hypothetical protein
MNLMIAPYPQTQCVAPHMQATSKAPRPGLPSAACEAMSPSCLAFAVL